MLETDLRKGAKQTKGGMKESPGAQMSRKFAVARRTPLMGPHTKRPEELPGLIGRFSASGFGMFVQNEMMEYHRKVGHNFDLRTL